MAISVDQDSDNELRGVGVLTKVVILLFDFRRIDALQDGFINKAVMVFGRAKASYVRPLELSM